MTTNEYPWLKCNQTWNTADCWPYPFDDTANTTLAPTTDPYDYLIRDYPGIEFYVYYTINSLSTGHAFAVLFTWIFALLPLIQGPKSLIQSLFLTLPFALFLNALLFFRAVSLPNAASGLAFIFEPDFSELGLDFVWTNVFRLTTGMWFAAGQGSLFVVGKYVDETIFPVPHTFVGVVATFILLVLNLLKIGGFAGFYGLELMKQPMDAFFGSYYYYTTMPVSLSQVSGAPFWLLVHFAFGLSIGLPYLSFAVEVLATCWAEFLPGFLSVRTAFPKNLVLTGGLGLVGFVISFIFLYLQSVGNYFVANFFYSFQAVTYCVAFYVVTCAIVPMGISKVLNQNNESLPAFVTRLGSGSSVYKVLFFICFGASAIVMLALPFGIELLQRGMIAEPLFWVIGALILFLICGILFLIYSILHCKDSSKYPCCLPLGRKLAEEPEAVPLGEKFPLDPLVT